MPYTVVLAEDDPSVSEMISTWFTDKYHVHNYGSVPNILRKHHGSIDYALIDCQGRSPRPGSLFYAARNIVKLLDEHPGAEVYIYSGLGEAAKALYEQVVEPRYVAGRNARVRWGYIGTLRDWVEWSQQEDRRQEIEAVKTRKRNRAAVLQGAYQKTRRKVGKD